jgi:hypothetical protein
MQKLDIRPALCCVAALLSVGMPAAAAQHAPDARGTPFEGTDDFLFDPNVPIDAALSAIACADGAPTGNPLQPCPEGSAIRVRGLPGQSIVETDDARFQGTMTIVANADFDPQYAGVVWGLWRLRLGSGEGGWRGVWYGRRVFAADPSPGVPDAWITDIRLIGNGVSGATLGLRVAAHETVITYTPIPLPYEALAYFGVTGVCPYGTCPPEGEIDGRIIQLRPDH